VAIVHDINRERTLLTQTGRWRLKPFMTLPTSIYELAKDHIPRALLEEEDGFVQLISLQTQCAFMNTLAEEQRRWKAPDARGQPDQLEVIVQFHAPLGEAITAVIDRCNRRYRRSTRRARRSAVSTSSGSSPSTTSSQPQLLGASSRPREGVRIDPERLFDANVQTQTSTSLDRAVAGVPAKACPSPCKPGRDRVCAGMEIDGRPSSWSGVGPTSGPTGPGAVSAGAAGRTR